MPQEQFARGLENVVVGNTAITLVEGAKNRLSYGGYDVAELAVRSTYDEVSYLLWNGRLPTSTELLRTHRRFQESRGLPEGLQEFIQAIPPSTPPIDAIRSVVSTLGSFQEVSERGKEREPETLALRLTAVAPTIASALWNTSHSRAPVSPHSALSHAANFLYMLRGEIPSPRDAKVMESMMILHADHEMNTSTFAARVAASAGTDMVSCVTSALATLKGPLHGGAGELVMEMVKEIGHPKKVESFVKQKLASHARLMGFGHRIYRGEDPRATVIRELARGLSQEKSSPRTFDILEALARSVRKERGLYPNVDLYSGAVYEMLGIPPDLYSTIFAVSRMAGWTAHVMEEYAHPKLICPQARYNGPVGLAYPVTETTRIRG